LIKSKSHARVLALDAKSEIVFDYSGLGVCGLEVAGEGRGVQGEKIAA